MFHVSMRVRHIEQVYEGLRPLEPELNVSCLTSVYFHVPRLRHLLWSGYVREARDTLAEIQYFIRDVVSEHTPAINTRMKRLLRLIDELATYLKFNEASMADYCRRYWKGQPVSSS